jgi:hypothetical protein
VAGVSKVDSLGHAHVLDVVVVLQRKAQQQVSTFSLTSITTPGFFQLGTDHAKHSQLLCL